MKYLLILLVISILFILLYRRLRPYIATAQHMLGIVRDVRRMSSAPSSEPPLRASGVTERLVRCASCNTWIPGARALKSSSSGSSYCSRACLERAAETVPQKRAGRL
ncbi:MAG TPA: hypothetical protein VGO91_08160 [Pyrinomonadaceae bacterium]|nr:hypothetical protein [Pyrinomonadaceae bacterium]